MKKDYIQFLGLVIFTKKSFFDKYIEYVTNCQLMKENEIMQKSLKVLKDYKYERIGEFGLIKEIKRLEKYIELNKKAIKTKVY